MLSHALIIFERKEEFKPGQLVCGNKQTGQNNDRNEVRLDSIPC